MSGTTMVMNAAAVRMCHWLAASPDQLVQARGHHATSEPTPR